MKLPLPRTRSFIASLVLAILLVLVWSSAERRGTAAGAAKEPKSKQAETKKSTPSTALRLVPQPLPASAFPQSVLPASKAAASSPSATAKKIKRVGSVVGVNEATLQQYILLHDHVWPEVLKRIHDSNMRNFSIFVGQLDDGKYYLFSYFEYVGDDFDRDMAAIGADPITRDWWKLTDPLQRRVQGTPVGDQWKTIKQVFHAD